MSPQADRRLAEISLAVHVLLGESVTDVEFGAHVDAAIAAHRTR